MPPLIGLSLFALLALFAGVIVLVPQTYAVEEMRDFTGGDKKAGAKSCPKGKRFSQQKGECVKTSCAAGTIYGGAADACIDEKSASLTDEDLYLAAGARVEDGRYKDALAFLFRIANRKNPQVLNLIGYATRKSGDLDKGIEYYQQALAMDPDYVKARQYLGEGYLLKGDVAKAKEQLDEIGKRCHGSCEEYALLVNAIASHIAEEPRVSW